MINKRLFLYASIFVLAGGAAATAGYLFGPAKTIKAEINDNGDDEDDGGFIPKELTAKDHFIDSLSTMKTLEGNANLSLSYKDFNVGLDINKLSLTLETLDNINAYVDATLTYNDVTSPISVTYVDNTVYASLLDIDAKFEVSKFTEIKDLLEYFNVEVELPEQFASLNIETLMTNLGNMEFKETDDGYVYDFQLLEGVSIKFYSDKEYNLTAIDADINVEGLKANIEGSFKTGYTYTEENKINAPENKDLYNDVNDLIPLAKHIGDLVKQTKFNLSLNSVLKIKNENEVVITGSTQFDLDSKSGLAKLSLVETTKDGVFNHNIDLDISSTDAVFNYNDTLKGVMPFASFDDLVDTIKSLMGNFGEVKMPSINDIIGFLDSEIIKDVLNGKYEVLLNGILKNVKFNNQELSFALDKSLLNSLDDIDFVINYSNEKINNVSIKNLSIKDVSVDLDATLNSYSDEYVTSIDRSDISSYSDYSNLIKLSKGLNALISQEEKKYAIGFNGSLTSTEKQYGLSFNGKARFDINDPLQINQSGDGEITIIEEESSFNPKPTHNVKVGVTGTDALFVYNNDLKGKFTVQTLRDMFGVAFDLIKDKDSRIYEWFGEMIDNMNSTVLMRVVNGEYNLLFHNIIKDITLTNNNMHIVVSGKILDLDSDITLNIGFSEDKISSIELVDFVFSKYTIALNATLEDYEESATVVPSESKAKYYDFSEIKTLLNLGINVANLDYFHIKGNASITLKFGSLDLKGLANMKNLPIDIKVFENNGSVSIMGKIENIPQQTAVNGGINFYTKTCEFYYSNGNVYIKRIDNATSSFPKPSSKSVKTTLEDFNDNILEYTLGFGLNLQYSNLIWNQIKGAMTKTEERTTPMNYANILTNFNYENGTNDYGEHRWDIGLNMQELTNNKDMKTCDVSLFGKRSEFYEIDEKTNEKIYKDFLSHLTFGMFIDTGKLSVDMSANLDLIDIDPNLTYKDFETCDLTKDAYALLNSYLVEHANDSPLSL